MDLQEFIKLFADEFEMTEPSEITAKTNYRELDEWDSLLGLAIIGTIKNNYGVKVSGEEIKGAGTVEGLFKLVESRIV